jgi:hypothetical protein
MTAATISRARMRELACLGRSNARQRAIGPLSAVCASRPQPATDASSIGGVLQPRPRAASSRPGTDDLMAAAI